MSKSNNKSHGTDLASSTPIAAEHHSVGARQSRCSVICTTYNHALYSRSALASIADQDWEDIEIIIVDDGSTDGNVSIMLEALLELDRPFTLFIQENTGNPALNANRALQAATGEYCCLMSLDDLLLPGSVSSKLGLMVSDDALQMVGNETYLKMKATTPSVWTEADNAVKRGRGFNASQMKELEYTEIGTFLLQGTIIRTDFLKSIGGFDEDITGDDLNLRTKIWTTLQSKNELHFKFLPMPGFVYRLHESNINLNSIRQVRTVLDWRDRYFPDRPLPTLAQEWIQFYIERCYSTDQLKELHKLLNLHDEVRRIHSLFVGGWKNRLRIFWLDIVRPLTK